jgi:tripartite-type tricarboxylate transporter receptor subunit TctC
MTMQARRRALLAVALALAATGAAPVLAQSPYPSKPVRVIVPFPPGQAADLFARMLADRLSQTWGQQVVVENRGGGGGVPGVMAVKDAAPDGYTWLVGTSGTLGVNPSVYAKIPYDPMKDFAPASNIFIVPLVVVAHPSFAPNTVQELVAAAKKAPGTINFASAGPGTAQHMTGELFKSRAGIDLVHVPYKGSGPGMTDLLGGQVPLMVDSLASALPHIKSGRIKIIAVTTAQRVPQLPNVPTIAESGYPGFEGAGWSGIVLPAGAPRDLVERVSADIQKALNEPQLHDRIIERGGIPDPRTPQGYADFIRAEIEKWAQVAKTANVRLDQ